MKANDHKKNEIKKFLGFKKYINYWIKIKFVEEVCGVEQNHPKFQSIKLITGSFNSPKLVEHALI